jgi:WD40 repeat protein
MKYQFLIGFLLIRYSLLSAQSIKTVVQKGHELAVLSVAISPDSSYAATGSRDKSIKLWELSSGREIKSILGHTGSVISIDFSSDGKYLISGSSDKSARIWDVKNGNEILLVQPDNERVTDVAFDPKGKFFVTVGFGGKANVWEFPSKKKMAEFTADGYAGSGGLIHLAISANGLWLAIGDDNSVATVYKTSSWQKAFTFNFSEYSSCGGCYTDVEFSPDSRYLIKATNRGEVARYDLTNGEVVIRYRKKVDNLISVKLSRDGKQLLVATEKDFTIYNTERGDSLQTINSNNMEAKINEAIFSGDGKKVLTATDNNRVQIWDIAKHKKVAELTGFVNQVDKGGIAYDPNSYWDANIAKYIRFKNGLLLSRDNKTLLKGKFGVKAKQWNISSGKTEMEYVGHQKAVLCYQYSRDGKKLVTGGADGRVIIWDAKSGDSIRVLKSYREPVFDVNFSSDDSKIVSTSWEGAMKIHDTVTGDQLYYFDTPTGSVYNAIFSRNDLYLVTASLPDGLQLRELDTQKIVREFVGHAETVSSIRLTEDGKKLMSASWDGTVRIWDIATGLAERKFSEHKGSVYAAIFNSSEKAVFSAGADRIIRLWDVATGKTTKTFVGHQSEVCSLQLTTDEKMLISHSVDGITKFWDLSSGKEFFEHIHVGEKDWMVKSPDGYFNGTQKAREFIHFVDGLKTYSVDQFFDEFYRPDLLPKIFQSRGGNDGKSLQGKLQKSPPPSIKVAALPSSDPTKADVFIKMIDNGAGVENLKVFHNGKSVALDKSLLRFPSGKDQSTVYHHLVSMVGGNNVFSASANNKDKIGSDIQSAEIFSEQISKSSRCYVLAVGINQYKNPRLALNYAKPDAESFGKIMDEKGKLFKQVEIISLYDTDASRANILRALDDLSEKVTQEDVFIFYYAGHGSMVENQFYFIPTESLRLYDHASLQRDALEASVLQEKFKNIKALKQLIVMDACQSGGSVELLANRGAAEEKAIEQLARSAGIHVMASTGSEQFATEFSELGHGLFTYLLLKALQGDADGSPKDGKVTVYELKSYLEDQAPDMTRKLKGKPQYPYTFSRGQDFPIVIDN